MYGWIYWLTSNSGLQITSNFVAFSLQEDERSVEAGV